MRGLDGTVEKYMKSFDGTVGTYEKFGWNSRKIPTDLSVYLNINKIFLIVSTFLISAIKSVTNYFLANLSVADFLISFTCIPIQVG